MHRLLSLSLFIVTVANCGEFTTWIGGPAPVQIARVAADASGNTWFAGTKSSRAVIGMVDPTGNLKVFRTVSGSGPDTVADLALDASGNIYIAGSTSSTDFPTVNAMQAKPGAGFLTKIAPAGNDLVWSTYYREAVAALAVDQTGAVYVTGTTNDSNYPVTHGLPASMVSNGLGSVSGAFLTKISADGLHIVYSTVLAGVAKDCGSGSSCFLSAKHTAGVSLKVDATGAAYLAGNTDTKDLPTTPGSFLKSGPGPFVAKVQPDGSGLVYLTYISGTEFPSTPVTNPASTAVAIACDASGNAYLTGTTFDPNFPTTAGAFQTAYNGPPLNSFTAPSAPPDAFALELSPDGNTIRWATYLGGSAQESVKSMSLDGSGQVWLTGTTTSPDYPNAQGWIAGSDFLTGLNANGTKLVYSARYPNDGASQSVSSDSAGALHVAGPTGTLSVIQPSGPPTPRIFGVANAAAGPLDGRVASGEVISIYGPHIGPATPVITAPDASGNLPTSIPGYQVIVDHFSGPAPAALLYASDSQINAIVPFGVYQAGAIHINTPNGATPDLPVSTVTANPAMFPVLLNQDGTVNSQSNPAPSDSWMAVWATGAGGPVSGYSGKIATAAADYQCCEIATAAPTLTGYGFFPVAYAGAAPGVALGVVQVNFQVKRTGAIRLVTADGSVSPPLTVYVK